MKSETLIKTKLLCYEYAAWIFTDNNDGVGFHDTKTLCSMNLAPITRICMKSSAIMGDHNITGRSYIAHSPSSVFDLRLTLPTRMLLNTPPPPRTIEEKYSSSLGTKVTVFKTSSGWNGQGFLDRVSNHTVVLMQIILRNQPINLNF